VRSLLCAWLHGAAGAGVEGGPHSCSPLLILLLSAYYATVCQGARAHASLIVQHQLTLVVVWGGARNMHNYTYLQTCAHAPCVSVRTHTPTAPSAPLSNHFPCPLISRTSGMEVFWFVASIYIEALALASRRCPSGLPPTLLVHSRALVEVTPPPHPPTHPTTHPNQRTQSWRIGCPINASELHTTT
jgi:hypothetical protein